MLLLINYIIKPHVRYFMWDWFSVVQQFPFCWPLPLDSPRKEQDKRQSSLFRFVIKKFFFFYFACLGPRSVESNRIDGAALARFGQLTKFSARDGNGSRWHVVTRRSCCRALLATLPISGKRSTSLWSLQFDSFRHLQTSGAMSQHSQFGHHHHHPHSHPAVLHNASLAEIASQPTSSHHYSSNLGSAVASSMHLTNSTSETDAGNASYKMEHDMMYYSVSRALLFFVCRRVMNIFVSSFCST